MMAVFLFTMSCIGGSATALLLAAVYLPILAGCNFSIGPSLESFALDRLTGRAASPWRHRVLHGHPGGAGCIGSSFYVGIMSGVQQAIASGETAQQAVATGFSGRAAQASVLARVWLRCHGAFRSAARRRGALARLPQ